MDEIDYKIKEKEAVKSIEKEINIKDKEIKMLKKEAE